MKLVDFLQPIKRSYQGREYDYLPGNPEVLDDGVADDLIRNGLAKLVVHEESVAPVKKARVVKPTEEKPASESD